MFAYVFHTVWNDEFNIFQANGISDKHTKSTKEMGLFIIYIAM